MNKTTTVGDAVRMNAGFLGLPIPSLIADPAPFASVDLRAEGAIPLIPERLRLPRLSRLGIDLRERRSLTFLHADESGATGVVAAFPFGGAPGRDWWRSAHEQQMLAIVFARPETFIRSATAWEGAQRLVEAGALTGVVPLAIFGFADGIGTTRTGGEEE